MDFAGGFGFSTSTEDYVEGHTPRHAFLLQNTLGWWPLPKQQGHWIAMHLEYSPRLAFASVIFFTLSADTMQRAHVTSYKLSFTNTTNFHGYWFDMINPDTGGKVFRGLASEEEEARISYFEPTMIHFMKLHPQTWTHHIAVRWSVVFCHRK